MDDYARRWKRKRENREKLAAERAKERENRRARSQAGTGAVVGQPQEKQQKAVLPHRRRNEQVLPTKSTTPPSRKNVPMAAVRVLNPTPASSVSFSQSPGTKKHQRIQFDDSDSSSDEGFNLEAFVQQEQKKQEQRKASKKPAAQKKDPPKSALWESDEDVRPKSRAPPKEENDDDEDDPLEALIRKQTVARKLSRGTTGDDDDDDPLETLIREKKLARKRPPRNPITQMNKSLFQKSPIVQQDSGDQDALWSDSDNDDDEKTRPSHRKKRNRESSGGLAAIRAFEALDSAVDESELKPELPNAHFGPFELEPLVLSDNHAVPASMNRYLPNYQQEGIRFMYQRTVDSSHHGVILGDDMGLVCMPRDS